jgi:ribose transport system substrate-binding protein
MKLSRLNGRIRPGLVLVAASGLVVLTACTSSSSSSPPVASDTPSASSSTPASSDGTVEFRAAVPGSGTGLKLGLIALGDSAVPFSKLVTDSMKAEAAAAGADLIVCDSALDGAKALACAQSFKTQGVQGYLNFQVDAKVAAAICAQGPQVPVIAIDIEQKPCQISFMGASNEHAGEIAGQALGTYIKTNKDCKYDAFVSMEQLAAGAVNDARMGGYRKGFESVCGPITNLKQVDGGGALDSARTKFADVLTSLPNAKTIIVVGINDDSILGSLAAAKTAGRADQLFMSGQGADPSSWCQIKNNPNWVVDAAYFPEKYGQIGIPYLIDAVKGKAIPSLLLIKHEPVTAANITQYYPSAGTGC